MRLLVCTLFPRVTYTFGMHIIPTSDHRLAAPLTPAIGMAGLISFHDRRHDALHVGVSYLPIPATASIVNLLAIGIVCMSASHAGRAS
jgi:hypothetical protein